MPKTIEELRSRQGEIRSRIEELDNEYAGQPMTDEARTEWEGLEEEHRENDTLLEELEFRAERVAAIAGDERHQERGAEFNSARPGVARGEDVWDLSTIRTSFDNPEAEVREVRDRAMRAIDGAIFPHPQVRKEDAQAHLERLVGGADSADDDGLASYVARHILRTGSPKYRAAMAKFLSRRGLTEAEQRSLNLGSGEQGAYLLPFTLDPSIVPVSNGAVNPLRNISRVVQTATNEWKGVTSSGMSVRVREEEGQEAADNSPKFAQPEITCHPWDAFAQWSYEFGQDYGSINAELATMVQEGRDEKEAEIFATGSGVKQPQGFITGATELIETATKEAFAADDLYTLEEKLPPRFRRNAQFVANRAIYNRVNQMEGEGGPLWVTLNALQAGLENRPQGNLSRRLLDYPTNELSTMASTLGVKEGETYKANKILAFGDFRYYVIADRIGVMAKPIDNIPGPNGRPTGQAGLFFFWRNGAKVMSPSAFRLLETKAA